MVAKLPEVALIERRSIAITDMVHLKLAVQVDLTGGRGGCNALLLIFFRRAGRRG
jgi:hypothetical protein